MEHQSINTSDHVLTTGIINIMHGTTTTNKRQSTNRNAVFACFDACPISSFHKAFPFIFALPVRRFLWFGIAFPVAEWSTFVRYKSKSQIDYLLNVESQANEGIDSIKIMEHQSLNTSHHVLTTGISNITQGTKKKPNVNLPTNRCCLVDLFVAMR
jgi:hypothetical protein